MSSGLLISRGQRYASARESIKSKYNLVMSLPGQWVGRAEQQARVRIALRRDSPLRGVCIVGPPGVGKTRLGLETLANMNEFGYTTHVFRATASSKAIPFGVVAGVVDDSAFGDHLRLIKSVIATLLHGSDGSRTVVMFDDAQNLDDSSALIVHQLATTTDVHIILTMRSADTAPAAVLALFKDRLIERVQIPPIVESDCAEVMRGVLGGPVESASATRMWTLTEGNMLYLIRIIEDERQAGRLAIVGGAWVWRGMPSPSADLVELVHEQMGSTNADLARLIDLLAIAEPLPFDAVRKHLGRAVIELAESRGFVTASSRGRPEELRLAHPLFGEVRRASVGAVRASHLRGLAVSLLAEARPLRNGMMDLRMALLTLDSDLPPDSELFLRGSREAARLVQPTVAERLAKAAEAAGAGPAASLARTYAATLTGKGDDAQQILRTVMSGNLKERERVEVAVITAANQYFDLEDYGAASKVLKDAADSCSPAEARILLGSWTNFRAFRGQPLDALRLSRGGVGANAPPIASLLFHWGLMIAHGDTGNLTSAKAAFNEAIKATDADPNLSILRMSIAWTFICSLAVMGEVEQASSVASRVIGPVRDLAEPWPIATRSAIAGMADLASGRLDPAIRNLSLSSQLFHELRPTAGWGFASTLQLVTALSQSGDLSGTQLALELALDQQHRGMMRYDSELALAGAWAAAATGADSVARTRARAAADIARSRSQYAVEALALHTCVRFGDRECSSRLAALADVVDGPRVQFAARHALGVERRDAAALCAVADDFEAVGDLLSAADAAAHASATFRSAGLNGSALTASSTAQRLAAICGGSTSLAINAISPPTALSEREREIARLAGLGMSNRAIADLLVISVRTVEGHVYRASAKLGASSRSELAELLPNRSPK